MIKKLTITGPTFTMHVTLAQSTGDDTGDIWNATDRTTGCQATGTTEDSAVFDLAQVVYEYRNRQPA